MVTVKIDGMKTLKETFGALAVCLDANYSEPIIFNAAKRTQDAMQQKAPGPAKRYSTHRLAKGWAHIKAAIIRKKMTRHGPNPASVIVGVDRKLAPQGQWLEYGTAKMAAQPFVRPGWNETKTAVLSEIITKFRALIIRGEGLRK